MQEDLAEIKLGVGERSRTQREEGRQDGGVEGKERERKKKKKDDRDTEGSGVRGERERPQDSCVCIHIPQSTPCSGGVGPFPQG